MASLPLPQESSKDDPLCRQHTLHAACETTGIRNPSEMQPPCPMPGDPLQAPALVTPLATAFPPLGSVPYIPNFSATSCMSPDPKIVMNGSNGLSTEGEGDVEEEKKRDREHKKRSKNWTRPETLKLIRLRTELAPRFARTGRKSELWDKIASGLQQEQFLRDAQQCRDKWEKLVAGYKEVRDGLKDREDNPFFEELHPLLSAKTLKKDRENFFSPETENNAQQSPSNCAVKSIEKEGPSIRREAGTDEEDDASEDRILRKRKRDSNYVAITDLHAVQTLLETVFTRQQKIVKDFLDALEHKEQAREQMRQEREEKWRAEERIQRSFFNHAMIGLTEKLVGEKVGATTSGVSSPVVVCNPVAQQGGPMKRSKNWKRGEVLQLIKLRGEMESKFAMSTRRAALWDELAEVLRSQGIKRDAKQCREKWDKLMAEYKDVQDGKREQGDSPYFQELMAVVGARPGEAG